MEALVAVNEYMSVLYEGSFEYTDNRYENMVEFLQDPEWDADGSVCKAFPILNLVICCYRQ